MDNINKYIELEKNIKKRFNIDDNVYIKSMLDTKWKIRNDNGIHFLSLINGEKLVEQVIVNKDGKPNMTNYKNTTCVVAIDCVKIAFLLLEENKID